MVGYNITVKYITYVVGRVVGPVVVSLLVVGPTSGGRCLGGPYNFLMCTLSCSDSSWLRPIPRSVPPLIHSAGKLCTTITLI